MNEVVVITGASAGVGRAAAHEFARNGAKLGLLARGEEALQRAKRECEELGGTALVIPTDVSDARAVEAAAERVERELGAIDVWINDAMVSVFSPVKQMTAEEYQRVTEVTYLGFVYGTLAALKRMLPRDRGPIVQVGSALAYRSIPLQSAYCAAKHAMVGFTDSLRCELHHDGSNVQVTVVHMPALNTPQFRWVRSRLPRKPQPVPPIYQPEVAARALYAAAHSRRREVFVGAPTVLAIEGQKFVPGLLDYYLGMTGYDLQQTWEPADPARRDNLYEPLPELAGTHGDFDRRASQASWQWWADLHRGWLAALAAIVTGVAVGAAWKKEKKAA